MEKIPKLEQTLGDISASTDQLSSSKYKSIRDSLVAGVLALGFLYAGANLSLKNQYTYNPKIEMARLEIVMANSRNMHDYNEAKAAYTSFCNDENTKETIKENEIKDFKLIGGILSIITSFFSGLVAYGLYPKKEDN